jgi:hypothetical protein
MIMLCHVCNWDKGYQIFSLSAHEVATLVMQQFDAICIVICCSVTYMLFRFRQTLSVDALAKTNNYNWGMFKCYVRLIQSITPKWLVKKDN